MSEPWIIALIWAPGALVYFRHRAKYLITKVNVRRKWAIREAMIMGAIWPFVLVAWIIKGVVALVTAGLPLSERERAEEIAALEREVLDEDEPEESLSTLIRVALGAPEPAPEPLRCSRCGCPVVPGRRGHVHVPDLGGPSPCSFATVDETPEDREIRRQTERILYGPPLTQREVADLPRDAKYVTRLEFHRALHMGGFKSCTKCHPETR